MAIICRCEKATEWDNSNKQFPNARKPQMCPICGNQMFTWSSQKHGGYKTECFASHAVKPVPVAMIRGDVESFCVKESQIPGRPNICYPKAGEHSAELREAVKNVLESWGFIDIQFVEPTRSEKSESDTVITAIHVSPLVNIKFREAPKTQRVFVFDNKFGVVDLEQGYHASYEKDYHGWFRASMAVHSYGKENLGRQYLYEKKIVLKNRENLRKESEAKVISSQKEAALSEIRIKVSKIDDHQRSIRRYKEEIAAVRKKYESDFGEVAPIQKGEE